MIPKPGHLDERRQRLADQITRQRTELAVAYRGLIKPFQYTETAVAAAKVIRKNGWLIALAPTAVKLGFSFFGWEKKGRPNLLSRFRTKLPPSLDEVEEQAPAQLKKPLRKLAGHAWSLFQIYRKVRPYFP